MTSNQYWNSSDYSLFWAYRVKFQRETKMTRNQNNFSAWLSGIYQVKAIVSAFNKNANYFDQPIDFDENDLLDQMSEQEIVTERKKKIDEKLKLQAEIARERLAYKSK